MSESGKWTVMLFSASDNDLSPPMVSQIKALKDAGFHPDVNVLVHFDPNEKGAPTRIFNVNHKRKADRRLPRVMIGDGNDPFVRNMVEDDITKTIDASRGAASRALNHALQTPDAISASKALENFLGFCVENHQADHYILILLGHGMIVANDAFLPDNNPDTGITLKELGTILKGFTDRAQETGGTLELLGLHSCSMSALEIAYQLKGTAKRMMASEGVAYPGSWPYRQLLKKVFNTVERAQQERTAVDIDDLIDKLYSLSLYNATDYLFAGISLDLSLCSLEREKVEAIKPALQTLVTRLKAGLEDTQDKRIQELILLAHWKSQSYWQENYTDLFDFCRCLAVGCDGANAQQRALRDACDAVIEQINQLVLRAENLGWKYQYSHGLSIYFPWCEPIDEGFVADSPINTQIAQDRKETRTQSVLENYRNYAFTKEFEEDSGESWLKFLNAYFKITKRDSRDKEDGTEGENEEILEVLGSIGSSSDPLSSALFPDPDDPGKTSGSTGVACACASIKNYPTKPVIIKGKSRNFSKLFISEGTFAAFE